MERYPLVVDRCVRRLLLPGAMLTLGLCSPHALGGSLPVLGPPADPPCDARYWTRASSEELAHVIVQTAEARGPDEWAPCASLQLSRRGASSIPLFIDLLKNPLTRHQALFDLENMGEVAAPASRTIEQIIEHDPEEADFGMIVLSIISASDPATLVADYTRFASSPDAQTAISAIARLSGMREAATPSIDTLAAIALSDKSPPSTAVRIRAAALLTQLGAFEPEKVGSYLPKFYLHAELAGGICQGIPNMGATRLRPWAQGLRSYLSTALSADKSRIDTLNHSEPSVAHYRELMRTREAMWCTSQAIKTLDANGDNRGN